MSAKYDQQRPRWLEERSEGKRNTSDGEATVTVDDQITAYKSRSDDPTLKRPT